MDGIIIIDILDNIKLPSNAFINDPLLENRIIIDENGICKIGYNIELTTDRIIPISIDLLKDRLVFALDCYDDDRVGRQYTVVLSSENIKVIMDKIPFIKYKDDLYYNFYPILDSEYSHDIRFDIRPDEVFVQVAYGKYEDGNVIYYPLDNYIIEKLIDVYPNDIDDFLKELKNMFNLVNSISDETRLLIMLK